MKRRDPTPHDYFLADALDAFEDYEEWLDSSLFDIPEIVFDVGGPETWAFITAADVYQGSYTTEPPPRSTAGMFLAPLANSNAAILLLYNQYKKAVLFAYHSSNSAIAFTLKSLDDRDVCLFSLLKEDTFTRKAVSVISKEAL